MPEYMVTGAVQDDAVVVEVWHMVHVSARVLDASLPLDQAVHQAAEAVVAEAAILRGHDPPDTFLNAIL